MAVTTLVAAAAGLLVGAAAAWFGWAARARTLERERAALAARATALESERQALASRLEETRIRLETEVARRAAAEQEAERVAALEQERGRLVAERERLATALATLEARAEAERQATAEKLALVERARETLGDAFAALAAEALSRNNESFLALAREALGAFQAAARGDLEQRQQAIGELLHPVRETLERLASEVKAIETARAGAYAALSEQVRALADAERQLRAETAQLAQALKTPAVRGRWGEVQLRRVVELAGMVEHVDFVEQMEVPTETGVRRPDLVVHLPGAKHVVVDAKVPLSAYLEAVEASDERTRTERLRQHARQVREHVQALGRRQYWEALEPTPEFVVLFLPGEAFFSAAVAEDPGLIEDGAAARVILATPTTLIALLKAVAYGWRQVAVEENARRVGELGRELYKRLGDLGEHLARLGRSLEQAVGAYNRAVGSAEARVFVTARKLRDLADSGLEALPPLEPVDAAARALTAPEWRPSVEAVRDEAEAEAEETAQ